MFRNLSRLLDPTTIVPPHISAPDLLFDLHPVQLHRYLDEAWRRGGIVSTSATPVFLGESANIVNDLSRPLFTIDPSGQPPLPPAGTQPWEHLIYAYLLENTGMFRIFQRVVELYATGESLEVPASPTRRWLRTTEELLLRDPPPFSIGSLTSHVRPDLEATRRNAYWRLLGMDLDTGAANGQPYRYTKPVAANLDFVANFESFLSEVWQSYINRQNTSGENYSDAEAVINRADLLAKGLRVRRLTGNLAREEFFFTAVMSWFHLTLESDNIVITDLKATAANPAERLRKIGERVGITPHPRSRDLIEMADAASMILRFVELEYFNTQPNAAQLSSGVGAISTDVLRIINHWSLATGRNLKVRKTEFGGGSVRNSQPLAGATANSRMN
jgi:hypothetical protein